MRNGRNIEMSSLTTPPIDYGLIRTAIARTMQQAVGLDSNSVVELQWDEPVAKRPDLPFGAFMLTGLAQSYGRDAAHMVDDGVGVVRYHGPRMVTAMFQFFGETVEQAFGMACQWHAALDQEPTLDMLFGLAGLAVWSRESPTNTTDLLYTGYEGRASVNVMFGIEAVSDATVGIIEHVPVSGAVAGSAEAITVSFTADKES